MKREHQESEGRTDWNMLWDAGAWLFKVQGIHGIEQIGAMYTGGDDLSQNSEQSLAAYQQQILNTYTMKQLSFLYNPTSICSAQFFAPALDSFQPLPFCNF